MALGTSPLPQGAASFTGVGAETIVASRARAAWRDGWQLLLALPSTAAARRGAVVRGLAVAYLAALGGLTLTAWSGVPLEADGFIAGLASGVGQMHVAFLMLAGGGLAFFTLQSAKVRGEAQAPAPAAPPLTGLGDLLAQMSHELRTPLNAVIGFSDVMRHELHGPLGNARYQEYAAHISESGGRMLKSSEDALAVAEAMTVLLSREPNPRRERLIAGPILRDAWRTAGQSDVQLDVVTCNACDITCERRSTLQALEHLLREAARRAGPNGRIEVVGGRRASQRTLAVGAYPKASSADTGEQASTGTLATLLARLLLESQGARLETAQSADAAWTATVTFGKGCGDAR